MTWSQIRRLLESRALQATYVALFLAPLMAAFWRIGHGVLGQYLAAILLAGAAGLYAFRKPQITTLDSVSDAKDQGWTTMELVRQINDVGLSLEDLKDKEAKTQLNLPEDSANFAPVVFLQTKKFVDTSRGISRRVICALLTAAMLLLLTTNALRFSTVMDSYLRTNKLEGNSMSFSAMYLRIGDDVEVDHEGKDGNKTTEGKLINPNDSGSVVVETDKEIVTIPEDKIYEVRQPKKG